MSCSIMFINTPGRMGTLWLRGEEGLICPKFYTFFLLCPNFSHCFARIWEGSSPPPPCALTRTPMFIRMGGIRCSSPAWQCACARRIAAYAALTNIPLILVSDSQCCITPVFLMYITRQSFLFISEQHFCS